MGGQPLNEGPVRGSIDVLLSLHDFCCCFRSEESSGFKFLVFSKIELVPGSPYVSWTLPFLYLPPEWRINT